jgi:hypothetical protein
VDRRRTAEGRGRPGSRAFARRPGRDKQEVVGWEGGSVLRMLSEWRLAGCSSQAKQETWPAPSSVTRGPAKECENTNTNAFAELSLGPDSH